MMVYVFVAYDIGFMSSCLMVVYVFLTYDIGFMSSCLLYVVLQSSRLQLKI
jgi:hypothetical protein